MLPICHLSFLSTPANNDPDFSELYSEESVGHQGAPDACIPEGDTSDLNSTRTRTNFILQDRVWGRTLLPEGTPASIYLTGDMAKDWLCIDIRSSRRQDTRGRGELLVEVLVIARC